MNKVMITGRLTREPELKYLESGTALCNFTLAVENDFNDGVEFIPCVAWNKTAELAANKLAKGLKVLIDGRLQIRKNKTQNKTYINPEVVVNYMEFLEYKKSNGKSDSKTHSKSEEKEDDKNIDTANRELTDPMDSDFDVPF